MKIHLILSAILVALLCSSCTSTLEGKASWDDFSNDSEECFYWAFKYYKGDGVKQDLLKAKDLFENPVRWEINADTLSMLVIITKEM